MLERLEWEKPEETNQTNRTNQINKRNRRFFLPAAFLEEKAHQEEDDTPDEEYAGKYDAKNVSHGLGQIWFHEYDPVFPVLRFWRPEIYEFNGVAARVWEFEAFHFHTYLHKT